MTIDLGEHSRPTVATIARVAGVSVSAVSSVLNNRQRERRIAGETVEKIREAAARLGYLPNVNARRLRGDTATRAAIVLALVTSYEAPIPLVNHFIAALRNLAAGGKEGAKRTGPTSVSVEMFSAGKLRELPGLLSGDHFNAALILNTTPGDDAFLQSVTLPYPVVLVNRSIAGYSAVFEDESAGARAAAILASAGRRKLAVLHGLPLTQMTETRLRNFRREARQLTGKPAQAILTDGLSEEGGYRAMRDFLGSGGRIDGIYAVSDAFALGGAAALKEAGFGIPDDVAVVGVGDYEVARFFDPPLTSVGVSHRDLAARASEVLFERIESAGAAPRWVPMPVVEIHRESTAARDGGAGARKHDRR